MSTVRIARVFFSLTLIALPGCRSIESRDFETNSCDGMELEGLTPAEPVDYLELRSDRGSGPAFIAEKQGSLCANAPDQPKCRADFKTLRLQGNTGQQYLAWTRKGAVGVVTNADELRAFLAPFDTEKEGAFLLRHYPNGVRLQCTVRNARSAGDAFEFFTASGSACERGTHRDAHVTQVTRSGEILEKETERLEDGDGSCGKLQ